MFGKDIAAVAGHDRRSKKIRNRPRAAFRLSVAEREDNSCGLQAGYSCRTIARQVSRSASWVGRWKRICEPSLTRRSRGVGRMRSFITAITVASVEGNHRCSGSYAGADREGGVDSTCVALMKGDVTARTKAFLHRNRLGAGLLDQPQTPRPLYVVLRTACRVDSGLAAKWPGRPLKEIFADLT